MELNNQNSRSKMMKNILIIEDSKVCGHHIKTSIDEHFSIRSDLAINEKMAREMLPRKRYDLIIIDVILPDSSGNFVGELIRNGYRVIIITGAASAEDRSRLITLNIVDYIIKNDAATMSAYIIKTIQRLNENRNTVIGICDDSKLSRQQMAQLIDVQNLSYIEFENGQEVVDYLKDKTPKMDVLLTDYEMPKMNGLELVQLIRHDLSEEQFPIISLSASGKPHLTAQFLKAGANDYIPKPYCNEEFLTRLNLTLDHLYMSRRYQKVIEELEHISIKDFLTKLYNRHFFFANINHITANALRTNNPYGILMIDIDFFKTINDTYGHHAGDLTIAQVASIIEQSARESDYSFRWGGEEFLVLIPTASHDDLKVLGERIRSRIEKTSVSTEGAEFSITVSIGGAVGVAEDAMEIIGVADEKLYVAKQAGRNCVHIDESD